MKKFLVLLLAFSVLTSFGCAKKEIKKDQSLSAEKKLAQMGAESVNELKTNKPEYDRMELDERGRAYSVELFENRKISVETNFKGEVILISANGEEIQKINDKNKTYIPAKDGKYYIWMKNNAIPNEYYIIIKTFNKALFNADADELPGTKIEKDGLITGVVDRITDPVDYFYFPVAADTDLRIYYNNSDIDVVIMNKYKEETQTENRKSTNLFIMDAQNLYLKITPKKCGVPYEINLKRTKSAL